MDYPFIPLPKWFIPLCPLLNGTEVKVMLVIFDQTLGWAEEDGKRQTTNILAYTFLQHQTGITSRTQISNALKKLESLGLIKREPRRMNGQRIEVSVQSPIVAIDLVKNRDSGVSNRDSQSLDSRPSESRIETHIKKPPKKPFIEPPTMPKFTPDMEKGLAILVGGGVEKDISRQLIVTAWRNGRDSEYIEQIVGYVFSVAAKNPPGMIVTLITQNSGRIHTSQGLGPMRPGTTGSLYHYHDNGGLEFEKHSGRFEDCQICQDQLQERGEQS